MAATSVATILRIRKQTIRESLSNFQGVEHRLEKVLKIQNVHYINDSKATNVNATFFALDSMTSPTVWIVGGVDKGNDYSELMALVNEKVNVDRKWIKQLRAMLHDLKINGVQKASFNHFKKTKQESFFVNRLRGNIAFLGQVRGLEDKEYVKYHTCINTNYPSKKI
jgi:UDP-N-acetylmuramoylalanine-D-glutamate ligase